MKVLVSGNPFDGMVIFGPLTDDDVERNVYPLFEGDDDWWVVDLIAPTDEGDGILSFYV